MILLKNVKKRQKKGKKTTLFLIKKVWINSFVKLIDNENIKKVNKPFLVITAVRNSHKITRSDPCPLQMTVQRYKKKYKKKGVKNPLLINNRKIVYELASAVLSVEKSPLTNAFGKYTATAPLN